MDPSMKWWTVDNKLILELDNPQIDLEGWLYPDLDVVVWLWRDGDTRAVLEVIESPSA